MSRAGADPREPAAVELGPAWVRGRSGQRLMVILRAPGCAYARRTGGCTNCGFGALTTDGARVAPEDLLEQLRRALDRVRGAWPSVAQAELFCSGSFLCDEEIPAAARGPLLAALAQLPALRALTIESRPEYVTSGALRGALAAIGGREGPALDVAIGLESADEEIRMRLIRKGFSLRAFEAAAERLAAAGAGLAVYLLLKPLGVADEQAVADVVRSGEYLRAVGERLGLPVRVALEPTFVPAGTPLYDALCAGEYGPPSLWSAVRAARALRRLGLPVHVGLSDEGLPVDRRPAGCPRCTASLVAALAAFNTSQDVAALDGVSCDCAPAD